MKVRLGINEKMILVLVLFAVGLLTGVSVLSYNSGQTTLQNAAASELEEAALEKQAALNTWVQDRQSDLGVITAAPPMQEAIAALWQAAPDSLQAQAAHDRIISDLRPWVAAGDWRALLLLDAETGQVLVSTDPLEEGKFRESEPFFVNGRSVPTVQNVYYSLPQQAPEMTIAVPARLKAGQPVGVLAGHLNLAEMDEIIGRRTTLHQTDEAFLVNASSLFVTQPRLVADPAVLQRGIHSEAVKRCMVERQGVISALDYRNVPAIIAYRWLPERELCLITKIDQTEAFASTRAFGQTLILIGGLALLVAVAIAFVVARSMTRSILALQAGARRFGQGDLDYRIHLQETDEIGRLAGSFNEMAARLSEKSAQLEQYTVHLEQTVAERTKALQEGASLLQQQYATLEGIIENADGPIFALDANSRYVAFNQSHAAGMKATYGVEIARGQSLFDSLTMEADRKAARIILDRVLKGERVTEVPYSSGDEHSGRYYEVTYNPIWGAEHQVIGVAVFANDRTEHKRAEERLERSERNLAQAERIGNTGSWDYDVASDTAVWSENMYRMCDVDPAMPRELVFKYFVENLVHPDDRAFILSVFQDALVGKRPYDLEYRIVKRNGSIRNIHAVAETLRDEHGKAFRMIGKAEDITERKRAEAQLTEQLNELRRWHQATLGRETRLLEVKREVNELLARLGEPPRYPSAETTKPPVGMEKE